MSNKNPDYKSTKHAGIFIALLFLVVPGLFLFFSIMMGVFNTVEVKQLENIEYNLLAREHRGAYLKVGKKISEVKRYKEGLQQKCIPAALFYQDDKKVIKPQLRSFGGCLTAAETTDLNKKFQHKVFKAKKAILLSVVAHPTVAYRKLWSKYHSYSKEHKEKLKFPVLFLYHTDGKVSLYASL